MPVTSLLSILVAIGARAHGICLAHVPVYFAVREIFHRFDWHSSSTKILFLASLAVGALLPLIAVELVYRYIETPLRQIAKEGHNSGLRLEQAHTSTHRLQ